MANPPNKVKTTKRPQSLAIFLFLALLIDHPALGHTESCGMVDIDGPEKGLWPMVKEPVWLKYLVRLTHT